MYAKRHVVACEKEMQQCIPYCCARTYVDVKNVIILKVAMEAVRSLHCCAAHVAVSYTQHT
jgi:hypothetical protein